MNAYCSYIDILYCISYFYYFCKCFQCSFYSTFDNEFYALDFMLSFIVYRGRLQTEQKDFRQLTQTGLYSRRVLARGFKLE